MIVQGHESSLSEFNFRKHVRPIFAKHCVGCHRVGGAAPMSLMEYGEAVPWANSVKLQVLNGTMPPWLPIDGIGDYRHVRSLTA